MKNSTFTMFSFFVDSVRIGRSSNVCLVLSLGYTGYCTVCTCVNGKTLLETLARGGGGGVWDSFIYKGIITHSNSLLNSVFRYYFAAGCDLEGICLSVIH